MTEFNFDDLQGSAPPPVGKKTIHMNGQTYRTWKYMTDRERHSIEEISAAVGGSHAAISARLRDFRKEEYGSHTVDKDPDPTRPGHYLYRLTPNPDIEVAEH